MVTRRSYVAKAMGRIEHHPFWGEFLWCLWAAFFVLLAFL